MSQFSEMFRFKQSFSSLSEVSTAFPLSSQPAKPKVPQIVQPVSILANLVSSLLAGFVLLPLSVNLVYICQFSGFETLPPSSLSKGGGTLM